jgi:hypothetical protein
MTPTDRKVLAGVLADNAVLPDEDADWLQRTVEEDPEAVRWLEEIRAMKAVVQDAPPVVEAMPHTVDFNWQRFRAMTRETRQGATWWERFSARPVLTVAAIGLCTLVVGWRLAGSYGPGQHVVVRDVWTPNPNVTAAVLDSPDAGIIWMSGLEYREDDQTVQ